MHRQHLNANNRMCYIIYSGVRTGRCAFAYSFIYAFLSGVLPFLPLRRGIGMRSDFPLNNRKLETMSIESSLRRRASPRLEKITFAVSPEPQSTHESAGLRNSAAFCRRKRLAECRAIFPFIPKTFQIVFQFHFSSRAPGLAGWFGRHVAERCVETH